MGGLERGLRDGMRGVQSAIGDVTPTIAASVGVGGGAAPAGIVLNVSIGTVVGPGGIREVAEQIRQELLKVGRANGNIFGGLA
jgi:hypothetical protein